MLCKGYIAQQAILAQQSIIAIIARQAILAIIAQQAIIAIIAIIAQEMTRNEKIILMTRLLGSFS